MADKTYMLWQLPKGGEPIETKIRQAIHHYLNKFGRTPRVCLTRQTMETAVIDDTEIRQVERGCPPGLLLLGDE